MRGIGRDYDGAAPHCKHCVLHFSKRLLLFIPILRTSLCKSFRIEFVRRVFSSVTLVVPLMNLSFLHLYQFILNTPSVPK